MHGLNTLKQKLIFHLPYITHNKFALFTLPNCFYYMFIITMALAFFPSLILPTLTNLTLYACASNKG
jgi:hypothetical protein